MPVTQDQIIKELARRELAKRKQAEPTLLDKLKTGYDAFRSLTPWMPKKGTTEKAIQATIGDRREPESVGDVAINLGKGIASVPFGMTAGVAEDPIGSLIGMIKTPFEGGHEMLKSIGVDVTKPVPFGAVPPAEITESQKTLGRQPELPLMTLLSVLPFLSLGKAKAAVPEKAPVVPELGADVPKSGNVQSKVVPPVASAQGAGKPWEKSGSDVGKVFHGSDTGPVDAVDMGKIGKRDAGYYGKGFYVTTVPKYSKTYGKHISEFQIEPNAKVLDVGTIHPGFEQKVNPGLQAEIESLYRQELLEQGSARAKSNPDFPDNYVGMIRPEANTFDLKAWIGAVDRYAEKQGYDVIRWSDGEIVVKNPRAITKPIPPPTPSSQVSKPSPVSTNVAGGGWSVKTESLPDNNGVYRDMTTVKATPIQGATLDNLIPIAKKAGLNPSEADAFYTLSTKGELYVPANQISTSGKPHTINLEKVKAVHDSPVSTSRQLPTSTESLSQAPVKAVAKEPWEMTRGDYDKSTIPVRVVIGGGKTGTAKGGPQRLLTADTDGLYAMREAITESAQKNGLSGELLKTRVSEAITKILDNADMNDAFVFELKNTGKRIRLYKNESVNQHNFHRGEIESAIKSGKPVPPEVLKDYPDLAKKPAGKGPQSRAAGFDPQVLSKMAKQVTPEFLTSAEKRIALPQSKQLFDEIKLADETRGVMEGSYLEQLRTLGLKKLSDVESVELGKQLNEGTGGQQYATVLEDVWRKAKDAGIEIGKVKNYFPRIIKREIAEKMYDDLRPVIGELKKGEVSDQAVGKALEKADQQTRDVIKHMIETGQAKGYSDAVSNLYYAAQHDLFKVSSFEKHRSLKTELPSWVYETDARQVLPMYIEAMSKRIADAKTWGPNLEKAEGLITDIRNADMREAATVEKVLKTHTGVLQQERALGTKARKFWDRFAAAEYGAKVGVGGTATIPNITQTLISTAQEFGYGKTLKSIAKLVTKPQERASARMSGAVNHDMMKSMTGYHPAGVWGKFADLSTKISGFTSVNKVNQYVAASTAKSAIVDYYKAAKGTGKYAEWAKQRLNDIGIDHTKPLTDDITARGMYRVATDTQLQSNIIKEPLWMNDPRWKMLAIFKRFSYKQFKYQKDMLLREAQRGNAMPMLRLAAGGYIGGEFVIWAKNQIKQTLSGEPAYRESEQATWDRFLENLAAVGSLGVFSDVAGGLTTASPTAGAAQRGAFSVTPVAVSEAGKAVELGVKAAKDYDRYGAKVAVKRNVPDLLERISPLSGQVGERVADRASKANRLKSFRGKKRMEIIDDFIAGKREDAIRKLKLWNQNHPKERIKPSEVGGEEQRKRRLSTKKIQAGVR